MFQNSRSFVRTHLFLCYILSCNNVSNVLKLKYMCMSDFLDLKFYFVNLLLWTVSSNFSSTLPLTGSNKSNFIKFLHFFMCEMLGWGYPPFNVLLREFHNLHMGRNELKLPIGFKEWQKGQNFILNITHIFFWSYKRLLDICSIQRAINIQIPGQTLQKICRRSTTNKCKSHQMVFTYHLGQKLFCAVFHSCTYLYSWHWVISHSLQGRFALGPCRTIPPEVE